MRAMTANVERRPVVGYEGLYSVTSDGRVWSLPKKSRTEGRRLKSALSRGGYPYVCLFKQGGGRQIKNRTIHRLVAEAFLPRIDGKDHVNHLNGTKNDNRLCNLEWCTPSENKLHAWRTGITKAHPNQQAASSRNISAHNRTRRKLSPVDIARAADMAARGHTHASIAPKFSVSRRTVSRVLKEGYR